MLFLITTQTITFSVKETKRKSRAAGTEGKCVHIGSDSQEMPQGDDKDFLKISLKKTDLIRRFNEFVHQELPKLNLGYPMVITLEKDAWEISASGVQALLPCNHEEAYTRIIYHCTLKDKPTVVVASDTDILVLLIYAFASRLPAHDWYL